MPRGKFVNHKGRSRHFTNPEELEEERRKEQKKKLQRESDSESESSEEEENDEAEGGDEEEDEDESGEDEKPKGVSGLIDIENPNRVTKKTIQKVGRLNLEEGGEGGSKPELTRREQEQIQKQKARRQYMKLHAEGKTKQAKEDLARLAIIKQHRAEAAARREQEKKEKEDARKKASNA